MSPFEASGWYWRASAITLTWGVLWNPAGYCLAGSIAIVHLIHMAIRERSLSTLSVQIRALYLALLVAASWEPLRPLYLFPMVGTWALVLYGYCFLARVLSLAPWNRTTPLNPALAWRILNAPTARTGDEGHLTLDYSVQACAGPRGL